MKAVNLLPNDMRGSARHADKAVSPSEPSGPGAFVVLGALAFCVAALAAYVLTTNTVKQRQAQLEGVTAQAQAAAQRAAELKPYADFDAMAKTRIQTVRDLAASRFDWEQTLRDISRAIPANVTLQQLNGSVSSQAGGGGSLRAAIAAPAVELSGCTTSQPAVATLMSRLRGVDGVTRVSLAKSQKPEQAVDSGAADSVGCGPGRHPSFEIVTFFESSTVPATVQDITTVPQAASAEGAEGEPPASGAATGEAPADQPAAGESTTTPASTGDGS